MTFGVGYNRQSFSSRSKQRATSGTEKSPSRVHQTSDKGQLMIAYSSKYITTLSNMERGEEVIILKKKEKSIHKRLHEQSSQIIEYV